MNEATTTLTRAALLRGESLLADPQFAAQHLSDI